MDAGDRYSRQRRLPEIGDQGQQALARSRAVVVGCGALGTVQAMLLVRAGVGETVLVDRDYVEVSNLQRQCIFEEVDADQGTPKAVAAAERLRRANSDVTVAAVVEDLSSANARRVLAGGSLILDGTDNYEARYLINDVAVQLDIPWVYGAAVGTRGSVMPVVPGRTACLRCVFPYAPEAQQPTCETAGVLNAVTSVTASLQVAEALKILVGAFDTERARLESFDVWTGERSSVATRRPVPECPTCGRREFDHLDAVHTRTARLCGRDAVQVSGRGRAIDLAGLRDRLAPLGSVRCGEYALRFDCPPHRLTVFLDGRAIVKGTENLAVARSVYARYVGS